MREPLYFLLKGGFYFLSLLPFWLLYGFSDAAYLVINYGFGYRRKVIEDNLRYSFPEKSPEEIKALRNAFYRHFCDVIFEVIKLMSISPEVLKKRVKHLNPEIITEMTLHGAGGIAVFGHFCNWEWLGSGMGIQFPFETVGVYLPLSNPYFDRLVLHIRSRLGNRMVPMKRAFRESLSTLKRPAYIAFLGDQTPHKNQSNYYCNFLNRPALMHLGIATIALKTQSPVYFFDMRKVKRGHYTVALQHLPVQDFLPYSEENVHRLTDYHVRILEAQIKEEPAFWLWSHRRWKYQPKS